MKNKRQQAGFTLIEMVVVVTIAGFLVLAATSLMASFARFKYATDVQQQLKAEANFAAGQIDLLIRNSNGLADLCLLKPVTSPADCSPTGCCDHKICRGKPIYVYWQTPNEAGASTYYDQHSTHCCPAPNEPTSYLYASNTTHMYPAGKSAERGFITLQELAQKQVCKPNADIAEIDFISHFGGLTENQVCFAESSQTVYNNNIIRLFDVESGAVMGRVCNPKLNEATGEMECDTSASGQKQKRLAVVKEEYAPGALENQQYLDRLGVVGTSENIGVALSDFTGKTLYLTSNAVHVSNLSFSCQLKNHGLPNQAALVTYTLTLEKPKRALSIGFYDHTQLNGFETFTITRAVNLRNSGNVFNLPRDN